MKSLDIFRYPFPRATATGWRLNAIPAYTIFKDAVSSHQRAGDVSKGHGYFTLTFLMEVMFGLPSWNYHLQQLLVRTHCLYRRNPLSLRTGRHQAEYSKVRDFRLEIQYKGHIARSGMLELYVPRTAALKQMTYPQSQTQLKSFLCLCDVYGRLVPQYVNIAHPFKQLLKKERPVNLTLFDGRYMKAFHTSKDPRKGTEGAGFTDDRYTVFVRYQ